MKYFSMNFIFRQNFVCRKRGARRKEEVKGDLPAGRQDSAAPEQK